MIQITPQMRILVAVDPATRIVPRIPPEIRFCVLADGIREISLIKIDRSSDLVLGGLDGGVFSIKWSKIGR